MNYQSEDRPMFDAVCSNCNKEAQVPFKPSGDRPVYCRECFQESRGARSGGGGDGGERQMFTAACATCGQEAQVPFRPTEGRPVYCREHYSKG